MIKRERPRGAVPRRKKVSLGDRLSAWRQGVRINASLPAGANAQLVTRVLKWLSLTAVLAVLLISLAQLPNLFNQTPLRHVAIEGDLQQLDSKALQSQLEKAVRGSFFNANLADLKRIAERQPWVESVVVYRQWPDRVRVVIKERQAVAYWGDDGALITAEGVVFRPSKLTVSQWMPTLLGPRSKAQWMLAQYQDMAKALSVADLTLQRLELTNRMSWHIRLANDVDVLVDNHDTIAKLNRFTVFYQRQLATEIASVARVDLRYRNGIAVGWRRIG